jgi:RND family efflux transporter MFP subunit
VLSAPFDGVVIERNADPGSMAAPGLPLLTLEDPTVFRLEVQVDEARAGTIRVGQDVQYRLDTHGERWTAARVSEIGRVDPSSHSFLVKVDVPGAGATRSGSFGRVLFPGTSRRTTAVPLGAVVRRGQLAIVFTVDAEGRARLRPISTGTTANELVEVLAGLNPNDTVVVSPPPGLVDGTRVVRQ